MSSTPSTGADETPTRAIAVLALASFASAANLRVCDPLLPQIAGELGVTIGTAATVVTAFALAYGVFQVVVGPLGDARGKLKMVVLGSLWAGVATVLFAAMPTLGPLVLVRFLGGAGAAAVIPVAIAWIGDVVPYERRQPVLARFLSGQILGIVFGQAAGGLLGDLIGWRATLVVLGLVHVVAGLLLLGEMRRLKVGLPRSGRACAGAKRGVGLRRAAAARGRASCWAARSSKASSCSAPSPTSAPSCTSASASASGWSAPCWRRSASARCSTPRRPARWCRASASPAWWRSAASLLAAGYAMLGLMPSAWLAPPAIALIGLGYYMLHNTLQTNATQMAPEARGLAVSLFAIRALHRPVGRRGARRTDHGPLRRRGRSSWSRPW